MKTKSPLPVAHAVLVRISRQMRSAPLAGSSFAVSAQATTAPHENNHAAQSAQKATAPPANDGYRGGHRGRALAGVTIRVKGTALGTTTDAQGRFTLHSKQGAVL